MISLIESNEHLKLRLGELKYSLERESRAGREGERGRAVEKEGKKAWELAVAVAGQSDSSSLLAIV